MQRYDGVISLDFGEVCAVAGVFQPTQQEVEAPQLIIKRGYLYARVIPNRDWLEARKAANSINDIQAALKKGLTHSTYAKYHVCLRQLKANDDDIHLWNFYSSLSVDRRI